MTDRPEGTPGEPAGPVEAPEPEAAEAIDEVEIEDGSFEGDTDDAEFDDAEDDLEDEPVVLPGVEPAPLVAATGGAVARRRGASTPAVQRAPTPSEVAVHVTDNTSRFLVIATVVVFVAILAWGLLAGTGGLLTATPAPTVAPSVSAAPSASVSPEVSASASPS